jgi:hypothetical protein
MRIRSVAIISSVLLSSALVVAAAAHATDRPIAGADLHIRRNAKGIEHLSFSSRNALLFPVPGSADDPASGTPGGATIELFSQGSSGAISFAVPRDTSDPGWRASKRFYSFRHTGAPTVGSSIASLHLHAVGGIRIRGSSAGLALDGQEQRVGIRITTGSIRHCALFGPATVRRDVPGDFHAVRASAAALTDCSDAALAPPPDPPADTCGDGVIDRDTESCDGAALGDCGVYGVSCGAPGFANACSCCSAHGELNSAVGCCNPSSVSILTPRGSGWCFALRCDGPFTCGSRSECQPDGDCCGRAGNPCAFLLTQTALQPCCAGLVCGRADASSFFAECCVAQGGACAGDEDCCSRSCSASGLCD